MVSNQPDPISKQATIIFGLGVVGFMAFGLAISFYRNILFEHSLQAIRDQNIALRAGIEASKREIEYFKSAQYKDKFAKENLHKVNPGENMLIFKTVNPTFFKEDTESQAVINRQKAAYEQTLRQIPIYEHWQLFLFNKDKVAELQQSL